MRFQWYTKIRYNMWNPGSGIKAVIRGKGVVKIAVLSVLGKDSSI